MSDAGNSYDAVPYQSVALVESHPERLATIARLFGLACPPVEVCRVLELGCAGGGNLIPLAQILPRAHFVGVDLSARQIADAKATAAAVGVTNIAFHARSLADIDRDFGEFDYILCHGVYSWVPDEVKSAILRICSENLARTGVAFVSYNTLPGWHVPGMIREMMLYHVRKLEDPVARVKAARAFIHYLAENVSDRAGHHAQILREESEKLRPHADSYVLHEHLEEWNDPVYYQEFAERASGHGLRVLSDSRFWSTAAGVQPPMAAVLDKVARSQVDREQYLDFLCNRRFRRSLLCHEEAEVSDVPSPERVKHLRASATVWPSSIPADFASKASVDFRAADGANRVSTADPVFKTALVILTEVYPRSLPFEQLWTMTRHRLGRSGVEAGTSSEPLAERLFQAYAANALELHVLEPQIPREIAERPVGLPVARLVAETSSSVPNLRHRQHTISEFDRLVLRQLDGTRSHAEVVERLVEAVTRENFTILENGLPIRDPAQTRPILERSLGPSLVRLNRAALLIA